MKTQMLDAAIEYAKHGYRIFPCTPSGKKPLGSAAPHGVLDATADLDRVRQWWEQHPRANIGVATDGLAVIDRDPGAPDGWFAKHAGDLELAAVASTPRGGRHYVFQQNGTPIRNSASKLAKSIDVRGDGGYIVVSPSYVGRGMYRWETKLPARECLPVLPKSLETLLVERSKAKASRSTTDTSTWSEGERNERLASLAGKLRRNELTAGEIEAALQEANRRRCNPPLAEREVSVIAQSISRYPAVGDNRKKNKASAESQTEVEPPKTTKKPTTRKRAVILITPDEQRVNDDAVKALGSIRGVFARGRNLVHVVRDTPPPRGCHRPEDSPHIAAMSHPTLREKLSAVTWLKDTGEELTPTHPPDFSVKAVYARGQWPGVRPLEAVVEVPVLRHDGTVLATPGYDPATGLLFAPSSKFAPVPETPTASEVRAATKALTEVVSDFPFVGDEHRAAWLAGVLTPLARHAFYGPAPLFLVDGNTPGCGKGLCTDVAAIIGTGRVFARMTAAKEDEEMRKRITAIAMGGETAVLIDNVAGYLGSPSLDAALTSTTWSDRLLGSSDMTGSLPLLVTWWATSNNASLGGDIFRRLLHIRLESREEHPEERTGFRHPNLLEYVRKHQGELTSAALTILRAYCAAGKPNQHLTPMGSFEAWSDLVRQAVVFAGLPDPCLTRAKLAETSDTTGPALRAFLVQLAGADPDGHGLTVSEIMELANSGQVEHQPMREALLELCPARGDMPSGRSVGMRLHHLRGRVVGGMYLHRTQARNAAAWAARSSSD